MTTLTHTPLRVAQVSELTGLSGYTLRFYEKEGLFGARVERDASGHRVYTEQQVDWLRVCTKLRSSGMSLPDIRRYAELFAEGPHTVPARHAILRGHEEKVRRQLSELQEALAVIEHKVAFYEKRMAEGSADELWRNGPECEASVANASESGT
jgi:DNA-binding transcriptional MerR regulator